MPNAGKSSLFNALTARAPRRRTTRSRRSSRTSPSCRSRDERLDAVADDRRRVEHRPRHDRLPRHRRPGRAARTRARAWATSSSPTSARPTRSSTSCAPTTTPNVVHPEGGVDPLRDIETIETELIYADLEQAERRLERVDARRRAAATSAAVAEEALAARTSIDGAAGRPPGAHRAGARRRAGRAAQPRPLTAKPVLFVANVDEGDDEVAAGDRRARRGATAPARWPSPRASRPSCPSSTTRTPRAMRADLGVAESGLQARRRRRLRAADLIAFFTAGEDKPAQSWHLRRGLTAWHAAGEIHSDIQKRLRPRRGDRLATRSSTPAATPARASAATLRLEGRDYVMRDGDVITVKFTP